MLTRRDQIKLKEKKAQEKKDAQEAKKQAKTEAKTVQEEAGEQGPRRGRKRKGTEEAEKKPENDKSLAEAKASAKSRRTSAKSKAKAKAEPAPKHDKENEDNGLEVEGSEVKPKARAKAKGKAKAKASAQPKEDPEAKEDESAEPKVPEPKAKGKAKAKSEPKKRAAKAKAKALAEPEDGLELNTPKKRLFQSDEDSHDPEGESPHERLNQKTGQVQPLRQMVEEHEVKKWEQTRPKKRPNNSLPEQAEPSAASAGDEGPSKKGRAKAKSKAKQPLSPFAKKEVKRRQKAEKAVMEAEPVCDQQLQGICMQHMKNVEKLGYEELKIYLRSNVQSTFKKFALNAYWGRSACGVKCSEGEMKGKEIAYFGRIGTAGSWNSSMVLAYFAASYIVFWLWYW